jgi:hypothetical protein
LPQENDCRNDPNVDGARIPPNTSVMAPCRRSRVGCTAWPCSLPPNRLCGIPHKRFGERPGLNYRATRPGSEETRSARGPLIICRGHPLSASAAMNWHSRPMSWGDGVRPPSGGWRSTQRCARRSGSSAHPAAIWRPECRCTRAHARRRTARARECPGRPVAKFPCRAHCTTPASSRAARAGR